ncbi:arylsulfatase [Clostridiales bacterium oral taxon 876 str. F0540]|nr:arylsulfatase [Clostridiales bacterium oral taxon 876 str. F0540]
MKKFSAFMLHNVDIYLFFISLTVKVLIFSRQIQPNYFSYKSVLSPIIASALVLCSFLFLINKRKRIKFIMILDFLLSFIIICDVNYYRYFKDIPSVSVVRNGLLLGDVKSSVGSLFKFSDLLFLSDLVVFFIIKELYNHITSKNQKLSLKLASFLLVLLSGCMLNGYYINRLSIEQPRLLSTMFNRVYIANELGIINAHSVDIFNEVKNDVSKHTLLSKEKENDIKTFLETNSTSKSVNLKGEGEGKNLIMIQVEALQQFVINKTIDGKEITPNLNKWVKKSAYFNNFFYQVSGGGTSDAEFMTNNSLYPAPSGAAYYLYAGNEYNSLGNALKNSGYSTAAFHGYKSTFWNRDVMYKNEGFDNFFNERDFNIDSQVGLGLSDKSFLSQSLEKLKTMQKPYYSFLITLSSHFPYDDQKNYGNFYSGELSGTLIGDYINAIHYTDEALGSFFDNLDKEGILKDSVVVLYGDHNAIPDNKKDDLAKFEGVSELNDLQWAMLQKVPMFIHFPEDKNNGVYDTFGGEMDIYPTLANIFSIESKNMLGKDLFNSTEGTVLFRNGSFTDGNIYYHSPSNTYYDITSGQKLSEDETLKGKKDDALTQLEYSDDILKHNLLKKYMVDSN